jgi:hypothetical protein
MKSPKTPKPSASEEALRQRQREDLARLDEEENVRIKGMLRSAGGRKLFRGARRSAAFGSNAVAASAVGSVASAAAPRAEPVRNQGRGYDIRNVGGG